MGFTMGTAIVHVRYTITVSAIGHHDGPSDMEIIHTRRNATATPGILPAETLQQSHSITIQILHSYIAKLQRCTLQAAI